MTKNTGLGKGLDALLVSNIIDKTGAFHYLKGENGAFNKKIEIPGNGTYTFAVRNNSDVSVNVTGFVKY